MLVSVIVTTFGPPVRLREAIISALNQSYREIEVIVVDDNSPGTSARLKTRLIVEEFGVRIRCIWHSENLNGSVARNSGAEIAQGEYLAFLDNDDEYHPERIEKLVEQTRRQSNCLAAIYTGYIFKRHGRVKTVRRIAEPGNFLLETLACNFDFGTGSNLFVSRRVYWEIGGFDPSLRRHQDYDFLVRYFLKYDIGSLSEPLVIKNDDNQPNLPSIERLSVIKAMLLSKYSEVILRFDEREQSFIYDSHLKELARFCLRKSAFRQAMHYYNLSTLTGINWLLEFARGIIIWIKPVRW